MRNTLEIFLEKICLLLKSLSIDLLIFPQAKTQGANGHWTVNYTGAQSVTSTLSHSLIQKPKKLNFD